jgi:cytochrome c553
MQSLLSRSVLIFLTVALATQADASELVGAQIALKGSSSGAPACTACHGENLQGIQALRSPRIAGLSEDYILARLAHYAGPDGHNAQMKQVATALGRNERQAVAAYLAGLKP